MRQAVIPAPGLDGEAGARPTTRREDLITVGSATWLIVGLFLDGYAHQRLITEGESFVTPWHAVFYAGFLATAASVGLIVSRRHGSTLRDRIPTGYGLAVLGLAGFAIGGIGDGLWHSFFGVEVGIDALLSPTHLLLMASILAIVTAPYRAAASRSLERPGALPLVSLGIGAALVAFFLNFVWGLGDAGFAMPYEPATGAGERDVIAGVASALVSTFVLTSVVLFAVRLGRPRPGTFTATFGLVSLGVHVAFEEEWIGVLAATLAGVVLDVILARGTSRAGLRLAVVTAMAAMWAVYFGGATILGRMAWPAEIWIGSVVLCALAAGGLVAAATSSGPGERPPIG